MSRIIATWSFESNGLSESQRQELLNCLESGERLFSKNIRRYALAKDEKGRFVRAGSGGYGAVYHCTGPFVVKLIGVNNPPMTCKMLRKAEDEIRTQADLWDAGDYIVQIVNQKILRVWEREDQGLSAEDWPDEEDRPLDNDQERLFLFILMERLTPVMSEEGKRIIIHPPQLVGLPEREVIRYILDIGTALEIMHGRKLLHRDVKPMNTFWDPERKHYKLGDFGISATIDDECQTRTNAGTRDFKAPEVEFGKYDYRADIYSLGYTLYWMLNDLKKWNIHSYSDVPPLPCGNYSTDLKRIACKACSKNPDSRYQTIDQMMEQLGKLSEKAEEKVEVLQKETEGKVEAGDRYESEEQYRSEIEGFVVTQRGAVQKEVLKVEPEDTKEDDQEDLDALPALTQREDIRENSKEDPRDYWLESPGSNTGMVSNESDVLTEMDLWNTGHKYNLMGKVKLLWAGQPNGPDGQMVWSPIAPQEYQHWMALYVVYIRRDGTSFKNEHIYFAPNEAILSFRVLSKKLRIGRQIRGKKGVTKEIYEGIYGNTPSDLCDTSDMEFLGRLQIAQVHGEIPGRPFPPEYLESALPGQKLVLTTWKPGEKHTTVTEISEPGWVHYDHKRKLLMIRGFSPDCCGAWYCSYAHFDFIPDLPKKERDRGKSTVKPKKHEPLWKKMLIWLAIILGKAPRLLLFMFVAGVITLIAAVPAWNQLRPLDGLTSAAISLGCVYGLLEHWCRSRMRVYETHLRGEYSFDSFEASIRLLPLGITFLRIVLRIAILAVSIFGFFYADRWLYLIPGLGLFFDAFGGTYIATLTLAWNAILSAINPDLMRFLSGHEWWILLVVGLEIIRIVLKLTTTRKWWVLLIQLALAVGCIWALPALQPVLPGLTPVLTPNVGIALVVFICLERFLAIDKGWNIVRNIVFFLLPAIGYLPLSVFGLMDHGMGSEWMLVVVFLQMFRAMGELPCVMDTNRKSDVIWKVMIQLALAVACIWVLPMLQSVVPILAPFLSRNVGLCMTMVILMECLLWVGPVEDIFDRFS